MAAVRVVVVPELHADFSRAGEEPSRSARIAAARARFGSESVELLRGELAHETAARLAAEPRCELQVVGGVHDEPAVAILLDALRERGLAASRFETDAEPARSREVDATASDARLRLLLRALGVDPELALYAGRGLRERNADSLVNLR